ncbi:MAG TPA: hypothetical protein VH643_35685 [Gemmataceae bacterium]|jgi:hypothetical protein
MNATSKLFRLAFFLFVGLVPAAPSVCRAAAIRYELGSKGLILEGVSSRCPMIYDNDWWSDTPDKDYLWAKASLGEADLRGNIVTRDLWDWQKGQHYKLEQGLEDARKAVARARHSGLRKIPDPVAGADAAFERPRSGKIEDTRILRSKGAELIVAEARKARPDKPLLVFVGGPLNTVANAVLMDASIAERMVVFMTDLRGYNGQDPWANYIVSRHCKLVNYGAHIWWPQRPRQPMMPLERFQDLPKNELTADLRRMAGEFWQRSTRKVRPDRDDGFADGAPLFLVFVPRSWKTIRRQRVEGVFDVKDVDSERYDLLDARTCDYDLMREEFFKTLANARVYRQAAEPDHH